MLPEVNFLSAVLPEDLQILENPNDFLDKIRDEVEQYQLKREEPKPELEEANKEDEVSSRGSDFERQSAKSVVKVEEDLRTRLTRLRGRMSRIKDGLLDKLHLHPPDEIKKFDKLCENLSGFDTIAFKALLGDHPPQQVLANTMKDLRVIIRENVRRNSLKMQIKELDALVESMDKSLDRLEEKDEQQKLAMQTTQRIEEIQKEMALTKEQLATAQKNKREVGRQTSSYGANSGLRNRAALTKNPYEAKGPT